jgi:hypothetical protein
MQHLTNGIKPRLKLEKESLFSLQLHIKATAQALSLNQGSKFRLITFPCVAAV